MDASHWHRHTVRIWRHVGRNPESKGDPEFVTHDVRCLYEGGSAVFAEGAGLEQATPAFVHTDTNRLAQAGCPADWVPRAGLDMVGAPGVTDVDRARPIAVVEVPETLNGRYKTVELQVG